MPIRKRFSGVQPLLPLTEQDVENDFNEAAEARASDSRGVFDPSHDAYSGSNVEALCGDETDQHRIRSRISRVAATVARRGQQPEPKAVRTQDLLAQLRIPHNPGENIERSYRQRTRSPLSAIRGFCVHECKNGSIKAVTGCGQMSCVLWAFRLGQNGLR